MISSFYAYLQLLLLASLSFSGVIFEPQKTAALPISSKIEELHFAETLEDGQAILVGTDRDGTYYLEIYVRSDEEPSARTFSIAPQALGYDYKFKTLISKDNDQYILYGYRFPSKGKRKKREACFLKLGKNGNKAISPGLFFPDAGFNSTIMDQVQDAQGQHLLVGNKGANLFIGQVNAKGDSILSLQEEPSIKAEVVKALFNRNENSHVIIALMKGKPKTSLFITINEKRVLDTAQFERYIFTDIAPFDSKSYMITGQFQQQGGDAFLLHINHDRTTLKPSSAFETDLKKINGFGEEIGQAVLCRDGGSIFLSGNTESYHPEARRPKSFFSKINLSTKTVDTTLSSIANSSGQDLLFLDNQREVLQLINTPQRIKPERQVHLKRMDIFEGLSYDYSVDKLIIEAKIINPTDADFGKVAYELIQATDYPYPLDAIQQLLPAHSDDKIEFKNRTIVDTLLAKHEPIAVKIKASYDQVMKEDTFLYLQPLPKHDWETLQESILEGPILGKDSFLLQIKSAHNLAIDECKVLVDHDAITASWKSIPIKFSQAYRDTITAKLSVQGQPLPTFKLYQVSFPKSVFQVGPNLISTVLTSSKGRLDEWRTNYSLVIPRPPHYRIISIGIPGHNLHFPPADAKAVAEVLQSFKGPAYDPKPNVTVLNQPESTSYNAIRKYFSKLGKEMEDSQEEDITFLYLSGHGEVDQIGMLNFWASDYDSADNDHYSVALMTDMLKHFSHYKGRLILLLDACYSGQAKINLALFPKINNKRIYGLCSCKPAQVSGEDSNLHQGIFTNYLIQAIERLSLESTNQLQDIYQDILNTTTALHPIQTVIQIEDKSSNAGKIFKKDKP